ncbi:hypothetical protein ANN_18794 [Periplaneta americana]|uniref:Uncharacterized protein n=1 Tax=Periplaneta americana TaxID=6978 RepID=A0ABQ8SPR4_PERAM|nr:hypothetical protein ANN_18794 [Periplaneta americana]
MAAYFRLFPRARETVDLIMIKCGAQRFIGNCGASLKTIHNRKTEQTDAFLNRRMRLARREARLAQIRITGQIVSGFYNCEMRDLRTSQP